MSFWVIKEKDITALKCEEFPTLGEVVAYLRMVYVVVGGGVFADEGCIEGIRDNKPPQPDKTYYFGKYRHGKPSVIDSYVVLY